MNSNLGDMDETKTRFKNFWDIEKLTPISPLKRGPERRGQLCDIIVATLKALRPQKPTGRDLQKLSRIRRKVFLPLLRNLVERGTVVRQGSGCKNDPFRYQLPQEVAHSQ